jgi:cell division protein FtsW
MYLPEAHTDFIFPIVCEELGGSVGILIVLLYALLLYFIGKESKKCTNIQGSVICVGVFSYILIHVLINLMGVLGLIPLTGVPLPFLSYGGSYNVTLIIALFFFQCVCVQNNVERKRAKIANL